MTPSCPTCGAPTPGHLTIRYQYPREVSIPEAADPWNVLGSAPLRTCGSVACEAAGMLAALDEIITDHAVTFGRVLSVEELRIVAVCRPGEFIWFADDGEEAA